MAGRIINVVRPNNLGIFIGLAIAFPGAVNAAQWYSESSARLRNAYDDNIRLTSRDHNSVVGMTLAGTIKAGRRTETSDVNLKGGVALKKYSGEDGLNTNNFDLGVNAAHRTQRNEFTLITAVKLDSTLTSEIQSSGLMWAHKRRIKKNFALSWTHFLSERTSLKLGYSHTDTDYKNAKNTGLSNYTYQSMDAMLLYSLNNKTVVSSTLTSSLYKGSNRTKTEIQDLGILIGIKHNFSETFSASAGAGVRYSTTEYKTSKIGGHNTDTGFLLNANVRRIFERTMVNGLVSRSVLPSGSGTLLITDQLSLEADYQVDERLSLNLVTAVYRNSSADEDNKFYDRIYYSIQPKIRWKIAHRWLVEGSYRYRYQRYDASDLAADSNAIFLSVKYVWPSKPSSGLW